MKKLILFLFLTTIPFFSWGNNGNVLIINNTQSIGCDANENQICLNGQCECHPKGTSVINGKIVPPNSGSSRYFYAELSNKMHACLSPSIFDFFGENNCEFEKPLQDFLDSKKIQCAMKATSELSVGLSADERLEFNRAQLRLVSITKDIVESALQYEFSSICGYEGEAQFVNGKVELIEPSLDPEFGVQN